MIQLPDKRYDIIYADPPWMERGSGKTCRGAQLHYPLMPTSDIIAMPVAAIAKDNCHLYLWVTNNFLPDGLEVMSAWGFDYKTCITWAKDKIGIGQYFRGQTEHILFGVKGAIAYKIDEYGRRQQATTLINAPRTEHSRKPFTARQMIEKVSDRAGFEKIELFAREIYAGWDSWGNQNFNEQLTMDLTD